MKKMIAIIVAVLVLLGGAGTAFFVLTREKTPEQQIVGTWYDSQNDVTIVFKKDKSFEVTHEEDNDKRTGTWKVAGEKLKLDTTSGPDATAEIPKGEIKSLFFIFEVKDQGQFSLHNNTYDKQ